MGSAALKTSDFVSTAVGLLQESSWYEAKLLGSPKSVYICLAHQAPGAVLLFHHFYEPWHRKGAVARLLVVDHREDEVFALLDKWEAVLDYGPWEREQADRDLYGEHFDAAMTFFMGSSLLADHEDGEWMTTKLVHCVLNASGMGRKRELRWALKFAWMSATTEPRLWLRSLGTGKKWWHQ